VRGSSHARHAVGAERNLERDRGRGALRRHQALGQRDHSGAGGQAQLDEFGKGLGDALGRHPDEHEVRAFEVVTRRSQRADAQVARQLHPGQVAVVLARLGHPFGLLGSAAQQRGAQAGPLQQQCNGGAERAGADDGGAARVVAGVADGGKLPPAPDAGRGRGAPHRPRRLRRMSEPRVPPLPEDEWSDLLRRVLDGTPGGTDNPMNIFTTLARHPELFESWLRFGGTLLMRGRLSARHRELVILRTAHNCDSPYEWAQHVVIGRGAGLTEAEIEDLRQRLDDHAWTEEERALLRAADELHHTSTLSDAAWQDLASRYDQAELIELVMLVGQYHMVAYALNALRVQIEDDPQGPGA